MFKTKVVMIKTKKEAECSDDRRKTRSNIKRSLKSLLYSIDIFHVVIGHIITIFNLILIIMRYY